MKTGQSSTSQTQPSKFKQPISATAQCSRKERKMNAIETSKNLVKSGKSCICNPYYLNVDESSQQGKSLLGQRTAFLKFHQLMFNMTDIQLAQLSNGYKRFYAVNKLGPSTDIFTDVSLIKDAIDYQLCIRSHDSFNVNQVSEEVVQSWQRNLKLAKEFNEITSDVLIDLVNQMLELQEYSKLTKCGIALFGNAWKSSLAEALNVDQRRITHWLDGTRPVPDGAWTDIKMLAEQRKQQIDELITKL